MIYSALAFTKLGVHESLYHLFPVLANFLGGALLGGAAVHCPRMAVPLVAPALLAITIATDALGIAGYGQRFLVGLPAFCLGAQNMLSKEGDLQLMTTLLTGQLQRVALAVAKGLFTREFDRRETVVLLTCLSVIVSTLLGALAGAFAVVARGESWTLVPMGMVQFACILGYAYAYDHHPGSPRQPSEEGKTAPLLAERRVGAPVAI